MWGSHCSYKLSDLTADGRGASLERSRSKWGTHRHCLAALHLTQLSSCLNHKMQYMKYRPHIWETSSLNVSSRMSESTFSPLDESQLNFVMTNYRRIRKLGFPRAWLWFEMSRAPMMQSNPLSAATSTAYNTIYSVAHKFHSETQNNETKPSKSKKAA